MAWIAKAYAIVVKVWRGVIQSRDACVSLVGPEVIVIRTSMNVPQTRLFAEVIKYAKIWMDHMLVTVEMAMKKIPTTTVLVWNDKQSYFFKKC